MRKVFIVYMADLPIPVYLVDSFPDDPDQVGEFVAASREHPQAYIMILEAAPPPQKTQYLIHELMHAALNLTGVSQEMDTPLEEVICSAADLLVRQALSGFLKIDWSEFD